MLKALLEELECPENHQSLEYVDMALRLFLSPSSRTVSPIQDCFLTVIGGVRG